MAHSAVWREYPVGEIERLIAETKEWRAFHAARRDAGERGAGIEAAACAIRQRALEDALKALRAQWRG